MKNFKIANPLDLMTASMEIQKFSKFQQISGMRKLLEATNHVVAEELEVGQQLCQPNMEARRLM